MDFNNQTILAPLTRGGNLPFRRLCADFGATMTVSEMAFARNIVKGEGRELALLRHHPSETNFGVQIAARQTEEAVKAAQIIEGKGANFIDINCGCPIHEITRRGLGSAMLQKPKNLGALISAIVASVKIPVTVKIRLGWSDDELNADDIAKVAEESGASALIIHGRTRTQRYTKASNWEVIGEIASKVKIPVIGNGDILTYYEAQKRKEISRCSSVMIGRGALIKPWIFQELKESREMCLDSQQRMEIYWKFTQYMKEHFREDEKGRKRAMYFLPWHFSFFSRYRALPEDKFKEFALNNPLIQTRSEEYPDPGLDQLSKVLSSENEEVHLKIAEGLWGSKSLDEAIGAISSIEIADGAKSEEVFLEGNG